MILSYSIPVCVSVCTLTGLQGCDIVLLLLWAQLLSGVQPVDATCCIGAGQRLNGGAVRNIPPVTATCDKYSHLFNSGTNTRPQDLVCAFNLNTDGQINQLWSILLLRKGEKSMSSVGNVAFRVTIQPVLSVCSVLYSSDWTQPGWLLCSPHSTGEEHSPLSIFSV